MVSMSHVVDLSRLRSRAAAPWRSTLPLRLIRLPVRDKRHFFRLYANADQHSTEMWKRIATEGVIALNWRELTDHHAKKSLVPTLFVVRSGQRQAS